MSRVKSENTAIERKVFIELGKLGIKFEKHPKDLPGKPDIVLRNKRIALFIDGDFWHGWQFPRWEGKLPPYWRNKITKNRCRDGRNSVRLKRTGWVVKRFWGHQINNDVARVVAIIKSLGS